MRSRRPSRTAEAVAMMRATDQARPEDQRILDDPFAREFLGPTFRAALRAWASGSKLTDRLHLGSVGLTTFVLTRHRYIDDRLHRSLTGRRKPNQVVILGAGYDMRAHRIVPPGVPVFEVDHPATAGRKRRIMTRLTEKGAISSRTTHQIEIDFQRQSLEEVLADSPFVPEARTFFVWEGVSMYLTREAVESTLATVARLGAPGSTLVFDLWFLADQPDLRSSLLRASASLLQFLGEPILFGLHPDDCAAFLSRQGYKLHDLADAGRLEDLYVRDGRKCYPVTYVVEAST